MKRVLITGPIGGHYGRDIEVNLVAKSLYNHFELNFFSTGSWQNDSSAIRDLKKPKYSSLNFQLLTTNLDHNTPKSKRQPGVPRRGQCGY